MIHQRRARLAVAAALAFVPALAQAQAELKLAHWVPPVHTITAAVVDPLTEAAAGGDVTIRTYPGGELGAGPLEQYIRVLQGVADIAWGVPGYTSSQFPLTMISELPGAIPEGRTGAEALNDAWEAGLLGDEFPYTLPIALWTSEPNIFIMKGHDIRTPADVEGLKIRVAGSVGAAVIESLGGIPVQMSASEMYNALDTGLIDGIVTGSSAVADFRLDEVADSYTYGAPLGRVSFFLAMNEAVYDGLPDEGRAALDTVTFRPLSRSAEEGWYAKADEVLASLQADEGATVITLTEEEAAAFGALTEPVTQEVVAEIGGEEVLSVMQGE
ncbi:TRAP transporter substrate-binding protein [Pseudoroseicyclus aestuarii]|uniref:TRAP-type C4-dicarboxylate transport system substrate-binding protein n=1 Tax=Pseudoroseicyclus aestuarii TaxID=1795041 RepID=A0A318ST95_9RHOB|nr:TRAP transporter substrate-binding protein [Pseudoroseicyclus aestuarii]PYE84575.1 TRAP-type C4-dicarboxylate transport system substrate-binding protein [Pseudoroseicyclus aestuarii]